MTPVELPKRVFAEGAERGFLEARCREILQGEISDNETFHEFTLNLAKLVGGEEESGVIRARSFPIHIDEFKFWDIKLSCGAHSNFVRIGIVAELTRSQHEVILSTNPDQFQPVLELFLPLHHKGIKSAVTGEEKRYDWVKVDQQILAPEQVRGFCEHLFGAYQASRINTHFHS